MLSIDIGINNFGYAVYYDKRYDFDCISFTTTKRNPSPNELIQRLEKTLSEVIEKYHIEEVIIEQQNNLNTRAMCVMYAIMMYCYDHSIPYSLFRPNVKFKTFGLDYDTRNKSHKKTSINFIKNLLIQSHNERLLTKFETYEKKDDVSDALFQLLAYRYNHSS